MELNVNPLHPKFAVEVSDIKLVSLLPHGADAEQNKTKKLDTISNIRQLVRRHKVVVFRKQDIVSADDQIRISQWFGDIEEAGFEQHERSADRRILLVSNDESRGCTNFGTSGFHVDGSFMEKPNSFSIYHMVECPTKGNTAFISLNDLYTNLSDTKRQVWDRLWMVKTYKRIRGFRDQPGFVIHPLVYNHPANQLKTLCIHQGKTSRFIWDWGLNVAQWASEEVSQRIIEDIDKEISAQREEIEYSHKWESGDFIISDNLSVGHKAEPETQLPPSQVGLRVMSRTVIKGQTRPWKDPLPALTAAAILDHTQLDDVEREDCDATRGHSFGDAGLLKKVNAGLKQSSRERHINEPEWS